MMFWPTPDPGATTWRYKSEVGHHGKMAMEDAPSAGLATWVACIIEEPHFSGLTLDRAVPEIHPVSP
jgi:hypothetical protein